MWSEALRICKEYLPNQFATLQSEAKIADPKQGNHDRWQVIVSEHITLGQYKQAVLAIVEASYNMPQDEELNNILLKACDIVNKFVLEEEAPEAVKALGPRY